MVLLIFIFGKIFIVEYLDLELGFWFEFEYFVIVNEMKDNGGKFIFLSLLDGFQVLQGLEVNEVFIVEKWGVEELYVVNKVCVCLFDFVVVKDFLLEDGEIFDVFLFGGILGRFMKLSFLQ